MRVVRKKKSYRRRKGKPVKSHTQRYKVRKKAYGDVTPKIGWSATRYPGRTIMTMDGKDLLFQQSTKAKHLKKSSLGHSQGAEQLGKVIRGRYDSHQFFPNRGGLVSLLELENYTTGKKKFREVTPEQHKEILREIAEKRMPINVKAIKRREL